MPTEIHKKLRKIFGNYVQMKFIRIAFAIAILALTPSSLSLGDSGPSKDETKA